MLPQPQLNHPTIESVLEWLSDSSVHPRNKVNSFQWFHIPTLLTTHIPSQPTKQNNELLSQLLQRMMTILDECFDSHTPIANKRLLHSSLSQLSQSPSLPPSIKRDVEKCFASLKFVDEGPFAIVETSQLDLMESNDRTIAEMKEQLAHQTQKLEENERVIEELKQIIQQTKTEVARKEEFFISSNIFVAFSPLHYRVNGSTVTNISGGWVGCFTKPVSKGIHRLSIETNGTRFKMGVIDAAEYPQYLAKSVYECPQAAMMYNSGDLYSANKSIALNTKPPIGQELSAEADLEKRTLHFFIDGVQQEHHFINIPVPLIFAIEGGTKDVPFEITFWGQTQSHVTFEGTGHNFG
ncbi:hypothetical protein BLNAU_16491 [Blattamonas nauphoetae]|uniref:Uncharacterized protein n=1 Tax=Blattamonas nauphoetae TaxID=2049346 RepID=A0ABQ9X8B5_9EUKA|nr:hypothetical protein BLNAU_16491 [Blattamonas nauphoetae]